MIEIDRRRILTKADYSNYPNLTLLMPSFKLDPTKHTMRILSIPPQNEGYTRASVIV